MRKQYHPLMSLRGQSLIKASAGMRTGTLVTRAEGRTALCSRPGRARLWATGGTETARHKVHCICTMLHSSEWGRTGAVVAATFQK
jgi:hypothetical protein